MSDNLNFAKHNLAAFGYTCFLYNGTHKVSSFERGVKPLLSLYEEGFCGNGYSAADKVVGMGAAYLYRAIGVQEIFALVISVGAKQILESCGIQIYYDTLVPLIINRKGDGICPIEGVLAPNLSLEEAITKIKLRLAELNKNRGE